MMSILPRALLGVCALLVPLAVACEPAADDAADEPFPTDDAAQAVDAPPAELEAASDRYIAAWNGDDPGSVAEFFTADATAIVEDDTFQGREEIEDGWLQNVTTVSDLEVSEESARQVGGDWRSEGTYSATISPPDEESMEQTGRYNVTWTRDADGQWRIRSTEVQPDEPSQG